MRVALSGGIGAGKSAAAEYLTQRGFRVIDADEIARSVVAPGSPVLRVLRDAFGDAIVTARGDLDRSLLADIVFHDSTALRRLNTITHGPIGDALRESLDSSPVAINFVALPLFRPVHRVQLRLDRVWVIATPPEVALERLCAQRAMRPEDAAARIAAQEANEVRIAQADVVIWNDGSIEQLHEKLDNVLNREGLR